MSSRFRKLSREFFRTRITQIPQVKVSAQICVIRGIRERDFFRFLHADLGCCPGLKGEVQIRASLCRICEGYVYFSEKFKHISKICLSRKPIVI